MFHRRSRHQQDLDLHPHQWHFQDHSKERRRPKSREIPRVPAQCVFQNASIPYPLVHAETSPPSLELYPRPGHIASHLLLLECFQKLTSDLELGTPGTHPVSDPAGVLLTKTSSTHQFDFLKKAFKRFHLWISKVESILRHSAAFNRYGTGSHLHGAFTENYLPPLDVLLVWYYYQQNTQQYQRLISDNNFRLLGQICFPWHVLPAVIDQDTLDYNLPVPAQKLWQTFVGVPVQIGDCPDIDLDEKSTALTISISEFLEIAQEQVDLTKRLCHHRWLRSPSVLGTLSRGLQRYETTLASSCTARPQAISDICLDTVLVLILQTHRAFPAAWHMFLNQHALTDDESPAPPPYNESKPSLGYVIEEKGVFTSVKPVSDSSTTCFCWICERVRDEVDMKSSACPSPALSNETTRTMRVSSSDSMSDFSSQLHLSKDQIRPIIEDISLYRSAEELRQRRTLTW